MYVVAGKMASEPSVMKDSVLKFEMEMGLFVGPVSRGGHRVVTKRI